MRVIGYSFSDEHAAWRARETLKERYELKSADARIAPLADDGVILAVRAREENLDSVTQVLEQHGGEEVIEIDERWTGVAEAR